MLHPKREDQAGRTLFDEYAKVEEVDRRGNHRLFLAESHAAPEDIQDGQAEWAAEAEHDWNESADPVLLTQEPSGLEVENDAFQATTKLRHENGGGNDS
jgi:hypothetical protein